jgi:hypothetical protein
MPQLCLASEIFAERKKVKFDANTLYNPRMHFAMPSGSISNFLTKR